MEYCVVIHKAVGAAVAGETKAAALLLLLIKYFFARAHGHVIAKRLKLCRVISACNIYMMLGA